MQVAVLGCFVVLQHSCVLLPSIVCAPSRCPLFYNIFFTIYSQVTYNVDAFVSNPNCTNTTTPENFGYRSSLHTDSFNIRFDVRTIFTCVALNSQIAGINNMIQTQSFETTFQGANYTGGQFVDPQFPGMKPVFCVFPDNTTYRPLCTVIVGNAYTIPLFNHAGTNFNMPEICNCTEQLKKDVATNQYNLCELFDSSSF